MRAAIVSLALLALSACGQSPGAPAAGSAATPNAPATSADAAAPAAAPMIPPGMVAGNGPYLAQQRGAQWLTAAQPERLQIVQTFVRQREMMARMAEQRGETVPPQPPAAQLEAFMMTCMNDRAATPEGREQTVARLSFECSMEMMTH